MNDTNVSVDDITSKIKILINEWETVKTLSETAILEWETKTLKTIFPHRFENIEIILKEMIPILTKNDKFWSPSSSDLDYWDCFSKKEFTSFMDYFTRKLSDNKANQITQNVQNYSMSVPNECYIESIDSIANTSRILSLKKPSEDVINTVKKFGFNLEGYNYINNKLLLTFYHRIHSPVSGIIEKLIPVSAEEKIFGDNALWIMDIKTPECGHVYFMLVGESEIQDFTFKVKEGDSINIFDEIGKFNWGSQTVIFYDATKFNVNNMLKEGSHFFVGDPIFSL